MKTNLKVNDDMFQAALNSTKSAVATRGARNGLEAGYYVFEGAAKILIQTPPKTGRMYGGHQASAPGEAPATDMGLLVNSFNKPEFTKSGSKSSIEGGASAEYAPHLEFGTKNMDARPFIRPALFDNEAKISFAFSKEIAKVIKGMF